MTKTEDKTGQSDALIAAIDIACRGLVYTSETDAKIEPFFMRNALGEPFPQLVESLKKEFAAECAEADLGTFFARSTADQPWHTPLQTRTAKKFRKLRDLLTSNLTDLRVYRFGRIRIDILVLGRDVQGNLAGIKTRAVET